MKYQVNTISTVKYVLLTTLISLSSCSNLKGLFGEPTPSHQTSGGDSYGEKVTLRFLQNVPNLRFCLEKYLSPDESGQFKGSLNFRYFINRFGMVRNVSITSDQLKNIKAKGCMIKVITTIEMPNHKLKKDFEVRQPIGISMSAQ